MSDCGPWKSRATDVFLRSLDGAGRVVVEKKNALGGVDTHTFPAAELKADFDALVGDWSAINGMKGDSDE